MWYFSKTIQLIKDFLSLSKLRWWKKKHYDFGLTIWQFILLQMDVLDRKICLSQRESIITRIHFLNILLLVSCSIIKIFSYTYQNVLPYFVRINWKRKLEKELSDSKTNIRISYLPNLPDCTHSLTKKPEIDKFEFLSILRRMDFDYPLRQKLQKNRLS